MVNYFSNRYPYTDIHELNLDWIIRRMRELEIDMNEFKVVNNITFSGQWDITKQYPAWTIVNDNNIGYVSIKPVPSGVVLTNSDYWVAVIDYSAQIAGLQNRVVAIENDLDNNVHPDINALDTLTTDLNKRLSLLDKRKYIFIGDSFNTTDTPVGGVQIVPWSSKLVTNLGLSESDYYNSGVSGAGFTHGTTYLQQLQALEPSITDRNEITDIIVLGGINDVTENIGDVYNDIMAFCQHCETRYPNAMVTLGMISWSKNTATRTSLMLLETYYELFAVRPNVRVINNAFKFYHYYSMWQSDNIHPLEAGNARIAYYIANVLKGGTSEPNVFETSSITFNTALNVSTGNLTFNARQIDEMVHINITPVTINLSIPSIEGWDSIDLGTVSNPVFECSNNVCVPVTVYLYASNTFYVVPGTLYFDSGHVKLRLFGINSSGFITYNNITQIRFLAPIQIDIPVTEC